MFSTVIYLKCVKMWHCVVMGHKEIQVTMFEMKETMVIHQY